MISSAKLKIATMLLLAFILLCGCTENSSPLTLFDFEHPDELDRLSWKCGSMYSLSRRYQSSGSFSLKVEMYPSAEWPGFGFGIEDGWEGYRRLSVFVYNPSDRPLQMTCRIDDRRHSPPYEDRVNRRITLQPGANFLNFEFDKLRTSGTKRLLRLEEISCFLMFVHRPTVKTTIYVDDITLQ